MLTILALVATHVVALGAGAYGWPHVTSLVASYKASHAVKNAKALVAQAEAAAVALKAAQALVASQPVVAATGPTGTSGA